MKFQVFAKGFGGAAVCAAALMSASPALAQDNAPPELEVGRLMYGTLAGDGSGDEAVRVFMLRLGPEESAQIDVIGLPGKDSVDPSIKVIDPADGSVVMEDDDGGEGLNSRVMLYGSDAPAYRIEVSEVGESGGRFEIAVRPPMFERSDPVAIAMGQTIRGTIVPGQQLDFIFDAERGQQVSINMRAAPDSEIDSRLQLYQLTGTKSEQIAEDDDGGRNLDSMIRRSIGTSGQYRIRASLVGDNAGEYMLRLDDNAKADRPKPLTLALDSPTTLTITEDSPFTPDDGRLHQMFTLGNAPATLARRGCDVAVAMSSSAMDSYLEIGFLTPLGFAVLQSDDDGGEELNAKLEYILAPLAGEREWLGRLAVRASSFNGELGEYEVTMTPAGGCKAD